MKIALDCRLGYGVGSLLRNLVPRLAARVDGLVLVGEEEVLGPWGASLGNVCIEPFRARVYSVAEQFAFPYHLRWTCDLLHVPNYNVPLGWRGPLVVTINDLAHLSPAMPTGVLHRAYARFFGRQAVLRSGQLLTLSEFSRREIVAAFGVPPDRVTVAYCGVDRGVFYPEPAGRGGPWPQGVEVDEPFILTAGSLRPHKNLSGLLLAFEELKRRHRVPHRLLVTGEGAGFRLNTAPVSLASDVAADVRFAGFVSDATLRALYSRCAVFVFPSLYEGFGLPPLEAMACGAPVVASNRASLPEVVGDAGVLADAANPSSLAEAIYRVIAEPGLAQRLRARGLERAATFSWDRMTDLYLDVYARCSSASRGN